MTETFEPAGSRTEALRWLAKADEDPVVAVVVLESSSGVNWAACFHAQQATEKAIKALLVLSGIDFPRSHVLDRLLALLPMEIATAFDLDELGQLTPWAVAGRYPEDIANPSVIETRDLVDSAKRAVTVASTLVELSSSS